MLGINDESKHNICTSEKLVHHLIIYDVTLLKWKLSKIKVRVGYSGSEIRWFAVHATHLATSVECCVVLRQLHNTITIATYIIGHLKCLEACRLTSRCLLTGYDGSSRWKSTSDGCIWCRFWSPSDWWQISGNFRGKFDHTARLPTASAWPETSVVGGPPLQKSAGRLWHWHNCFVREISHTPTAKKETGVGPRSLLMVHKVTGFIP